MSDKHDPLNEAVQWYVKLTSEDSTEDDRQSWIVWLDKSHVNKEAWDGLTHSLSKFKSIPPSLGMTVLNRKQGAENLGRRTSLKNMALLLAFGTPAIYFLRELVISQFVYDYVTEIGERKTFTLPDGTVITLNTNTAVSVDISRSTRNITLHTGEMLVSTGHSTGFPEPITIKTSFGFVMPIGTKFSVREFDGFSQVALLEGKLKISPLNLSKFTYLEKNQLVNVYKEYVSEKNTFYLTDTMWAEGYIIVDNIPLEQLIDELSRYYRGILICDSTVKKLKVSGTYSVDDVNGSLQTLAHNFPVSIQSISRFIVMISALR